MAKTIYQATNDPGHGWLHVKRAELHRLGIEKDISSYSYQKGETVYLEEDCDMSKFLKAKKERGEEVKIKDVYAEHTPIRGYDYYDKQK